MATCPNGHAVEESQKFCPECGARVGKVVMASPLSESPSVSVPVAPPPDALGRSRPPYIVPAAVAAVVIIGLLLWLVLSSRGGPAGPLVEKHDITGMLTAPECGGGYDVENASVEVRDEDEKLIGSSTTGFDTSTGSGCEVEFTVRGVPKASFYQITIGTHGGPSYSYADMRSNNWHLALSLG